MSNYIRNHYPAQVILVICATVFIVAIAVWIDMAQRIWWAIRDSVSTAYQVVKEWWQILGQNRRG